MNWWLWNRKSSDSWEDFLFQHIHFIMLQTESIEGTPGCVLEVQNNRQEGPERTRSLTPPFEVLAAFSFLSCIEFWDHNYLP